MKTRNFRELAEPIKADPHRRANLARHRADTLAEIMSYNLAELRRVRERTQVELAEALGIAQPSVSRLEHTEDLQLSTLRGYIEALGGRVEITAIFGDERFPLALE